MPSSASGMATGQQNLGYFGANGLVGDAYGAMSMKKVSKQDCAGFGITGLNDSEDYDENSSENDDDDDEDDEQDQDDKDEEDDDDDNDGDEENDNESENENLIK